MFAPEAQESYLVWGQGSTEPTNGNDKGDRKGLCRCPKVEVMTKSHRETGKEQAEAEGKMGHVLPVQGAWIMVISRTQMPPWINTIRSHW
jgi:hypothetical protein